jgi:D-3-phosphoglycerate dehydrogenase
MATPARDIAIGNGRPDRASSHSLSVSTSPTATFHSPPASMTGTSHPRRRGTGLQPPKPLKPFDTQDIKILLLENVNQSGRDILQGQGYQVEALKTSLPEDQLIEKIRYASQDAICSPVLYSTKSSRQRCARDWYPIKDKAY